MFYGIKINNVTYTVNDNWMDDIGIVFDKSLVENATEITLMLDINTEVQATKRISE